MAICDMWWIPSSVSQQCFNLKLILRTRTKRRESNLLLLLVEEVAVCIDWELLSDLTQILCWHSDPRRQIHSAKLRKCRTSRHEHVPGWVSKLKLLWGLGQRGTPALKISLWSLDRRRDFFFPSLDRFDPGGAQVWGAWCNHKWACASGQKRI